MTCLAASFGSFTDGEREPTAEESRMMWEIPKFTVKDKNIEEDIDSLEMDISGDDM